MSVSLYAEGIRGQRALLDALGNPPYMACAVNGGDSFCLVPTDDAAIGTKVQQGTGKVAGLRARRALRDWPNGRYAAEVVGGICYVRRGGKAGTP